MKSFCRFCAEKHDDLQNIFKEIKFTDMIMKSPFSLVKEIFHEFEFSSDDQLSTSICQLCANTLKVSYNFYDKIKTSQYKLNEILNQRKLNQKKKILPILLPKECINIGTIECQLVQPDNKRIYQCFECPDYFKSLRKLNLHIKESHTKKNICIYCNSYYPENEIIDHININHKNLKYFCRICTENFSTQRFLFKHCKTAHNYNNGCFYCTKCNFLKFSERERLSEHINESHRTDFTEILPPKIINSIDIARNEIDLCTNIEKNELVQLTQDDELIMDVEFLDDFFLNQDENSFQFNDCWEALGLNFEDELKLKFSDLTNDSTHNTNDCTITKSVKDNNLYKCPHCNEKFSSQIKMFIHLGQIHNKNCLICNECGLKFNNFNEFIHHRKTHYRESFLSQQLEQQNDEPLERIKNKKISYECKYCKKIYNLKNNYLIHICKKNKSTKPQQILCNLCDLNFANLKELYAHKKYDHLNEQLQCSLCDKNFKTLPGLKYHLKTHDGIKSFICPYCDEKFLANVNLSAHIKAVHAVKKSNLCDLCDRRFATLDHLKKHVMSVHQKERNHLCSVCGSCFSQVSHLKQHSEIHKEKRKLQCEYCSKGFTRRIDLREHFEKFHTNVYL